MNDMVLNPTDNLEQQQYIDIHCHCLPFIDDGPSTRDEALELARELVTDRISTVIATPHQLGRYSENNTAIEVREAVNAFNKLLEDNAISLSVVPGGDVRVDERICSLVQDDKILTLADNRKYILLELPHEVFIDIQVLIEELAEMGVKSIISHPERNRFLVKNEKILSNWLSYGASLQVTSGSLLGNFGRTAETASWRFLELGWVACIATDAHAMDNRRPCMDAAFKQISIRLGKDIARLLCIDNPLSILRGWDIRMNYSKKTGKWIDEKIPS